MIKALAIVGGIGIIAAVVLGGIALYASWLQSNGKNPFQ